VEQSSDTNLRAAADPGTVQWMAVCRDCDERSDRMSDPTAATFWRLQHVLQGSSCEHRVRLVMSFRLPGGTRIFEVDVR
jgi:hypothetical protein